MINIIVSNLLIIITVLVTYGGNIRAANSSQTFNTTIFLSDKMLLNNNSNILRNLLNGDTNIILSNDPLSHNSTPTIFNTNRWQLKPSLLETDEIAVNKIIPHFILDENININNNFQSGINKSNQENNLKKRQIPSTLFLSNIELVNSSNLSLSSSSSSSTPEAAPAIAAAAAAVEGFTPTNSYFERVEMHESLMGSKNEKLLLHRNKRYLVFPEGSSFQLVFDLIIPIVDYTNFAIMGITCAVAWELPSKPPSEIIENFRTKLNDGTFGISRRNDSALQSLVYINSQRTEHHSAEDKKRWRQGIVASTAAAAAAAAYNHNLPQLSATTTSTTSGREQFSTYVPKPPFLQPSSNFYYNDYIQREKNEQPLLSFSYGQQAQQQNNYDYEMFDTNQSKTLYANKNGKNPTHRNDLYPFANKRVYYKNLGPSASKWNFQNWKQKVHQKPQQISISYSDNNSYFNKDNWWKRNQNRIEKQSHKIQQKWWKYQQNPQENFQKRGERTSRNRKVLKEPPKHRIYPIFGKRRRRRHSADHSNYLEKDDMAKQLHNIHTKEHLQTRFKLYQKIEKLFKTRGQNGTACVLRALCETERIHLNSYMRRPQSFVTELLRSVFALPIETLNNSMESLIQIDDRFVNAISQAHDVTQTCNQQYDDCDYSIAY